MLSSSAGFTLQSTMRILLVEDDADVARFIGKGLMEQAYAVDHAETGEAALYMAGINAYDVIILDVMIPSPDGLRCAAVCGRRNRRFRS
jgi:DNA-binding response OmpR family regulator